VAKKDLITNDPERYRRLADMVEDGYSINEIARSMSMCPKTIKRHFPDYHGIGKPGSPENQAVVKMAKQFKELEKRAWL
jgi:transposase-like protein